MPDRAAIAVPPPAVPVERLVVDDAPRNAAWDAFVATTPGGHHAQTSLWARVKAVLGWDATRLVVLRDGEIAGGVQLLTRAVGPAGSVAFAPRGPLLGAADDALLARLHAAMLELGRERRIRYVKVQPPVDRHDLVPALRDRGWVPSAIEAAPTATVRVDLQASEDELLRRMRQATRRHIRQAPAKGLEVREGRERDLDAYWRVIEATSRRQGFAPYPLRYYEAMWRTFGEEGRARLLMAELDGRLLSSTLLVGYGDSVTYKMGGWLGERTAVHPNEAIHWEGIRWARATGHRFYDFDGIHRSVALALQRDGELPEGERDGVVRFKLGFGGRAELFPEALDISPSPVLRPAVRVAAPHLHRLLSVAHRALGRSG